MHLDDTFRRHGHSRLLPSFIPVPDESVVPSKWSPIFHILIAKSATIISGRICALKSSKSLDRSQAELDEGLLCWHALLILANHSADADGKRHFESQPKLERSRY